MPDFLLVYFVYLLLAVPIVLLAFFTAKTLPIKQKIFAGFLIYGFIVGCASSYWWTKSDMPFLANLPAEELGHRLYSSLARSIEKHFEPAYYEEMPIVRVPLGPPDMPTKPNAPYEPTVEVQEVPIYDIPWIVDLPGIFIPGSTVFWGLIGLLIQPLLSATLQRVE